MLSLAHSLVCRLDLPAGSGALFSFACGGGTMSLRAMPMIVLNMGSEMLYILNQRLQAQKIEEVKRLKVIADVTKTMFADAFVSALFQEQDVYSGIDVRKIFDRLAHSSIMRLNAKSMSKLCVAGGRGRLFTTVGLLAPPNVCRLCASFVAASLLGVGTTSW